MDSYIIGHERIINNLKNAIRTENINHSYLFQGPKLIGKREVAKVFAKTLLCEKAGSEPCNICSSCLKFNSGNHPDLHIEKPQDKSFKKEQIQEIQRDIRTLPYEGKRKVFILENVDKMTQQAQNSFLKTLEEPPSYTVIIMTAVNNHNLLPTIISRSQLLKFTPIETRKIKEFIINEYGKTPKEAEFIAAFSNGIVGKGIKICESEEFKELREEIISIIDHILRGNEYKIFSASKFFKENEENIEDLMDILIIWFRDLLIMKESNSTNYIINKDKLDTLSQQCQKIPRGKIHDIIYTVEETKDNIISKVNYELNIEVMLLKIQEV